MLFKATWHFILNSFGMSKRNSINNPTATPFLFKLIANFLKLMIVCLIAFSLYLFVIQIKGNKSLQVKQNKHTLFQHFLEQLATEGPMSIVSKWLALDASAIEVSKEEKLINYKLKLVHKSISHYFENVLQKTEATINQPHIAALIQKKSYQGQKQSIKDYLQKYLTQNSDILEISLYDIQGEKLSALKYKNVPSYIVHANVFKTLKQTDNVLLKNAQADNLFLVSVLKKNNQVIGYISQTIDKHFFAKLLDSLEINQNLFYLKGADNKVIIDNYKTYAFINQSAVSLSHLFYKKLTHSYTRDITINLQNVPYVLGVVVEKNNMIGDFFVIITFLVFLYLANLIVQMLLKSFSRKDKLKHRKTRLSNFNKHENVPPHENNQKDDVIELCLPAWPSKSKQTEGASTLLANKPPFPHPHQPSKKSDSLHNIVDNRIIKPHVFQ